MPPACRPPPAWAAAAATAVAACIVRPVLAAPSPQPPHRPPPPSLSRSLPSPAVADRAKALAGVDAARAAPSVGGGAAGKASPEAVKAAKAARAAEDARQAAAPKKASDAADKRELERRAREKAAAKAAADRAAAQRRAAAAGAAAAGAAVLAAKWSAVSGAAAAVFRVVGGPSLLAATLRAPGLLFGRVVRCVEWPDPATDRPGGAVVSLRLRVATVDGLKAAIAKAVAEREGGARVAVGAVAHWAPAPGGGSLLEPLAASGASGSLSLLPDPAIVCWCRAGGAGLPTGRGALPPAGKPAGAASPDPAVAMLAALVAESGGADPALLAAAAAAPEPYVRLWRAGGAGWVDAARALAARGEH